LHISRVQIKNFANFYNLDISTGESIVVVGENKVGKSNFILALRNGSLIGSCANTD
jgi:putative ATP-dependent endonuclease of OLD family